VPMAIFSRHMHAIALASLSGATLMYTGYMLSYLEIYYTNNKSSIVVYRMDNFSKRNTFRFMVKLRWGRKNWYGDTSSRDT